jgi:HlyD family secretion protein
VRPLRASSVGLSLLVALGLALGACGKKSGEVRYDTQKVERGRIVARVTATGTLSALVTVQVGSQVSGRIASLNADFNAPVKKGQVIARLDPQLFEAAVEQARANLLAAQGNLSRARAQAVDAHRQAERAEALAKEKLVAASERDTTAANAAAADAAVAAAEGAVAQAKAALHQAEINLGYTTIVSPVNGVVISRSVDVGQTVAASLSAPTLFTIAEDLRKMQVDTNVAEADVGRIRPGMTATFTVDAFPGKRWKGTVRQVRNAPQTVQNVVTYDAVIDVDNPDLELKPGMTATVTFVYAEKDDVLRIPNAALRFRAPPDVQKRAGKPPSLDSGARLVWKLESKERGSAPTPVVVKLGVSDGTVTELVDGAIKEGDLLVTDASGGEGGGGRPGGMGGGAFRKL